MFRITKNWYELLKPELTSDSFKKLQVFLTDEYNNRKIYPTPENVFNALNLVKCVCPSSRVFNGFPIKTRFK